MCHFVPNSVYFFVKIHHAMHLSRVERAEEKLLTNKYKQTNPTNFSFARIKKLGKNP